MITERPNEQADTNDFEFDALAEAQNYRKALFAEFGPYLRGNVMEVGAGIGQMSEHLARLPGVTRALAVEPDRAFCARHRSQLPNHELFEGVSSEVPAGTAWDAVLSINVLEHIRDDAGELALYARFLRERRGALCLFVPARREIYAPIDKDFGHFRRYARAELREKLCTAGFEIVRLHYFNSVGYFAWWFNFCFLKKRCFEAGKVRLYDRAIFPIIHALEFRFIRPPFGQSLLAVARAEGEGLKAKG